jgi:O-antigen/teichoic acid export membrane protein
MVCIHVGVLLFTKTDLLLVNWLFERPGHPAVTMYSLASRWNPMIRSIIWTMLAVVTPVVTALDAAGELGKIREAILRGMRYALLLAALPCILFPMFAPQFLKTWLKEARYVDVSTLLIVLVVPIIFMAASSPIVIALRGLGRVRYLALVTVVAATANICLSLFLATVGGLGMLGIAVASSICCIIQDVFIHPLYASRTLGFRLRDYFAGYVRPGLGCLAMVALAAWTSRTYDLVGWPNLLSGYFLCSVFFLGIVYLFVLRKDDREILWQSLGLARSRP